MKAAIITIGDELLIGQVINTNSAWLAENLIHYGIETKRIITVPDHENDIMQEFKSAWQMYDIVITTGGLGPTHDDLTVNCVARFFNARLILNRKILTYVENLFKRRKISMPESNISQAMVPENAIVMINKAGTAPGLLITEANKSFAVLPGVPAEMKYICSKHLFPYLNTRYKNKIRHVIKFKTLHTIGIGESVIAEKLGDISKIEKKSKEFSVKIAFLPSNNEVRLRVSVYAKNNLTADKLIKDTIRYIRKKVGIYIYSYSSSTIEKAVSELLKKNKYTISIAESCTGGLVSSKLTDISGSSEYMQYSVVSYSNESKIKLLGVKKHTIRKYGAVSKETAIEMARGVRKISNTDIGISTTGIAGPTGASKTKPVGLVWIGYSDKNGTSAYKYIFTKDRLKNKEIMSKTALEIIRRKILKIEI